MQISILVMFRTVSHLVLVSFGDFDRLDDTLGFVIEFYTLIKSSIRPLVLIQRKGRVGLYARCEK